MTEEIAWSVTILFIPFAWYLGGRIGIWLAELLDKFRRGK